VPGFQGKIARHTTRQKQSLETEQTSEPESNMAEIIELSEKKLKPQLIC
jgi:hypothetical protein